MPVAASIHVLVVDDQMSIRSLVRSGLNQLGVVHIAEAADGVDAMNHQVGRQRILQQHRHRTVGLQVACGDRLAGPRGTPGS